MQPQPVTVDDLREIFAEVRATVNSPEHADHVSAVSACQLVLLDAFEHVLTERIEASASV